MSSIKKQPLLNPDVLAIDQDPLGRGGTRRVNETSYQLWTRQLSRGTAIAVWNRGNRFGEAGEAINVTIDLAAIGLGRSKLYDAWSRTELGQFEVWSVEVAAR